MSTMFDCVTVGAALLDTFVQLDVVHRRPDDTTHGMEDQCFLLGAKIDVPRIMQQSGGGATNVATTLTRQRLKVAVIAKIGDDTAGKIVLQDLVENDIALNHLVRVKGGVTGQSVVLVDPEAERTVLTNRGSGEAWTESDLDDLSGLKARWVYVTNLHGSPAALNRVFTWAREQGIKVAWNPGLADLKAGKRDLLAWLGATSLLLLNRDEAAVLLEQHDTPELLASLLHARGAGRAVITDGENPLAILDGNAIWTLTPNRVKAVDQTGAGDAFGSGVVASLLRGSSFRQAVQFGLANAEHVVMHLGAKTGIIYRR